MTLIRTSHTKSYTVVNNTIITDNRLSWKAKGIWLYAFSRPEDWQFYSIEIVKHSTDGKDAVKNGLRELEEFGYLKREKARKEDGKFTDDIWVMYETSQIKDEIKKSLPKADNPSLDNPSLDNPQLLSTKETKYEKKKEERPKSVLLSEQKFRLSSLLFEKIQENNPKAKPPNTDRWAAALDKMHRIDGYSWQEIEDLILFSQESSFWKQNILSADKLRAKRDTLIVQMKEQNKPSISEEQNKTFDENKAYAQMIKTDKHLSREQMRVWDGYVEIKVNKRWVHLFLTEKGFVEQLNNALRKAEFDEC